MTTTTRSERERIVRTLTFWLRPAFVLRVLGRFQRIAGFDRAVALASSTFTALIPLIIIVGAVVPHVQAEDAARTIISRYHLTGGGAEAVTDVLAPPSGTSVSVNVLGLLLLVVAILSFSRGVQRLFEQTWELKPLSVRNTLNDLIWIGGLSFYLVANGWIHGLLDRSRLQIATNLVVLPLSALFLLWSGRVLSARRIGWKNLMPFAVLGSVLVAVYSTFAAVWLPHLFSSYATRYGVIGAVFAMISALFCVMVVLVGSAAAGREVFEELDRIRRGERPPDDEVRREWDNVIAEARTRWQTVRQQIDQHRRKGKPRASAEDLDEKHPGVDDRADHREDDSGDDPA
jgi:uncharacterized BrkB/YihY/UPF0761 family membrane protein